MAAAAPAEGTEAAAAPAPQGASHTGSPTAVSPTAVSPAPTGQPTSMLAEMASPGGTIDQFASLSVGAPSSRAFGMLDQAGDDSSASQEQRLMLGSMSEPTAKYRKKKQIGAGSYGEAWLVEAGGEDGQPPLQLCAKLMTISKMSERDLHYAYSEIKCMQRLKHPNIITFVEDFRVGESLCIVTEYCNCGDMDRQLRSRAKDKKYFLEHEALFLLLQLTMGVDHIHSKRMLHRDLKPANVFLTSDGMAKLGDFGFSQDYEETVSNAVAKTFCGTPYYLAPELWKNKKYGKKADVWSLGVILFEMVALRRPFEADSMKALMKVVLDQPPADLPTQVGAGMRHTIALMLAKDATKRPTTRDLYTLDFLQGGLDMYEKAVRRSGTLSQEAKDMLFAEVKQVRTFKGKSMSCTDAAQPVSAKAVAHDGPIRKLGGSEKAWKDRYLFLRDGALIICDSKEAGADGKGLPLQHIRSVCAVAANTCTEPNVFGIETVKGRATWLQAPTPEAVDKWLDVIQLAISLL
eukprot:TRINITY_DN476_c0_g3_i1.p1 TRINITY_DN476_c0_g3~~TRINITY_DN476_c0_g3_i1.p1  ORF type:complete len:519 (+),score=145.39 TRINITY_DN476_c0_g3_i1:77-1633(+)